LKRALKNKKKAVLKNTQSKDVSVEQHNAVNPRIHHRVPTKAAMIGLAISMGATSLLVTRQSDRALAAEPVGNQNTTSTIPAAADTDQLKLAPTHYWHAKAVSTTSQPENPVLMEPTATSQVPGFGGQWQPVRATIPVPVPSTPPLVNKYSISSATTNLQKVTKQEEKEPRFAKNDTTAENQTTFTPVSSQSLNTTNTVSSEVKAQLKAQQEYALNRLQEKSDRLRASLLELRSRKVQGLSQITENTSFLQKVAEESPQVTATSSLTQQSEKQTDSSKANLISRLKGKTTAKESTSVTVPTTAVAPTTPVTQSTAVAPTTPVTQSTAVAPTTPVTQPTLAVPASAENSTTIDYRVKPGDTLAAIARAYGTSISELVKVNRLANPNQLQIAQKLVIPTAKVSSTSNSLPAASDSPVANLSNTTKINNNNSNDLAIASKSISLVNTSLQTNNQTTVNTKQTSINWVVASNTNSTEGIGGDSPIPKAVIETHLAKQQNNIIKTKTTNNNQSLRSLQEEIEKLRAKYRAQQSGNPVVVEKTNNNSNVAIPITVPEPAKVPVPTPVSDPKPMAVPIPVPQPLTSRYTNQPVKPNFRATRPKNEPVNPEFQVNRNTKVATPPMDIDTSQSFGIKRGSQVSPELPPLAAVDTYLPKPIEEITPTSTGYIWPAKGVLTSGFGMRWGRMHKGIDIANGTGTPIYASADGVVEKAGWNSGGYGNLVDIRHPDGSLTRYAHNSKILVRPGQFVHQGDTIALMGSTGFSTGPHSHFEIHPPGKGAVNPIAFLPQQARL
jgi:murein DD-endopeptidase MepM/ murein hydrolase activator NlpD